MPNLEKSSNTVHTVAEDQGYTNDLSDLIHYTPDMDILPKSSNEEAQEQITSERSDEIIMVDDIMPNVSPSHQTDRHFTLGPPLESFSPIQYGLTEAVEQQRDCQIGELRGVLANPEDQLSSLAQNGISDLLEAEESVGDTAEECSIIDLVCNENRIHDIVPFTEAGDMKSDVSTSSLGHLEINMGECNEPHGIDPSGYIAYNKEAVLKCMLLPEDMMKGTDKPEEVQPDNDPENPLATPLPPMLTAECIEIKTPVSNADVDRQNTSNNPLELQAFHGTQQRVSSSIRDETPSTALQSTNAQPAVQSSIPPGDSGSLVMCERLGSEYVTMTYLKDGRDIDLSGKDPTNDYKTAVDDGYDLNKAHEDQVTIEIMPNDGPQSAQLTEVTRSFTETVKYMRYREALRYHKKDKRVVSKLESTLSLCFFVLLLGVANRLDGPISGAFPATTTYILKPAMYASDGASNPILLPISLLMALVTQANLWLFGTGGMHDGVLSSTLVFFICYVITFTCNIISAYNVHNIKNSSVIFFLSLINLNNRICVRNAYFENILSVMYVLFLLGLNIWILFNKFIMPFCIAKMFTGDAERLSVTSIKPCLVALPKDSTKAEAYETSANGYIVEIQYDGERSMLRRILGHLIRNRLMQERPSTKVYQFVGQLNDRFKPHGYGSWQSNVSSGEVLIGYWENGLPLGPFNSRVMENDATFSNMLLGWTKCLVGGGLGMGIASVETCTNDPRYGSVCTVMKYRAEFFDCDNIRPGLMKHTGTHKFKASDENINNLKSDEFVLRLFQMTHNFVRYDFRQCDAYIHDTKRKNSVMGKIKDILGDILLQKPGTRHMAAVMKCILEGLQWNMPYFGLYDEVTAVSDDDAHASACGCADSGVAFNSPTDTLDDMGSRNSLGADYIHGVTEHSAPLPIVLGCTMDVEVAVSRSKIYEAYHAPEVCIFIHGSSVSTEKELQNVVNIFTRGKYPPHIKPITFGWPSFSKIGETKTQNYSSTISRCREIFENFLRSLVNNGVRHAHVIVDSTGASLFLETFALMTQVTDVPPIFHDVGGQPEASSNQITLLSVTMMFPEYNLKRFVSAIYKTLRSYCDIITIFGKHKNIRRFGFPLPKDKRKLAHSIFYLFCESRNGTESSQMNSSPCKTFGPIALPRMHYGDGNDMQSEPCATVWLDVDCIDVTWLPALQPFGEHERTWHDCREICADLRELIVCRKRAKDRNAKLDRIGANVWIYNGSA
ncbi:hypothetical protein, conserved [Babesia ovata]|uniref:Uncharacterized protein n=1 Tax=Babesia ovata TaxID=189622 RepID=A0A2H6KH54_9APIC|nr:uncharacterized protein BOVATA_038230 [Babesia ovata]GBE62330.1 hypothetical protein, conserved [Babesia ovata]